MKRVFYLFFVGVLALSFSYCSGDDGDIGPQGSKGEQGIQGEKGAKGDKGDKGDKGNKGDPGKDGKDGKDGKTGLAGPEGSKGDKGDKGEDGNADVTVYIYNGVDFTSTSFKTITLDIPFETFMMGSHQVYLATTVLYPLPGYGSGGATFYRLHINAKSSGQQTGIEINRKEGSGELYGTIYVLHTPAGRVVDKRSVSDTKNTNFTSLEKLVTYYSISPENIIDKR